MKKLLLFTTIIIAFWLLASPARAESSANQVLLSYKVSNQTDRQRIENYAVLTENGLAWANTELAHGRKTSALYCVPDKMAFTGSQLMDIMGRFVRERPSIGERPWGFVLMRALQSVFPCPQ